MKPRTAMTFTLLTCGWLGAATAQPAGPSVEKVVVRATAHFDFDKVSIRAGDQSAILAEVGKMKDVTWQTVTATGHTDSIGTPRANAERSAQRAAAVKRYLVAKGLDATMIDTAARASAAPVASNRTDDGRARNRRAEIEFQGVRSIARN